MLRNKNKGLQKRNDRERQNNEPEESRNSPEPVLQRKRGIHPVPQRIFKSGGQWNHILIRDVELVLNDLKCECGTSDPLPLLSEVQGDNLVIDKISIDGKFYFAWILSNNYGQSHSPRSVLRAFHKEIRLWQ